MTGATRVLLQAGGKVVVKKAGEVGTKGAATAGLKAGEQVPLGPPRAVTAEEARYILPARESTKTSMMPWKGWIARFLQEQLGEERYKKMRETVFFIHDDPNDLVQSPYPANRDFSISKTDPTVTAQFRYPSPGSQPAVRVPRIEADEDPFDAGHFKRDTRRRYQFSELNYTDPTVAKMQLELMDPDGKDEEVQEELKKLTAGPESSPGNKGRFATGPTDFDKTGLRATMSVNWAATNAELDKHMPDHLPTPIWMLSDEDFTKWYQERDLPVPVGAYYEPLTTPTHLRVARW
jgi:hypothetical protein